MISGNTLPIQSKHLKNLRKNRGFTQEQIADLIGCTVKTYRSWEKGETRPDTYNLIALSELYHVSTDYLLGLIEEKDHDIKFIHEYTGLSESTISVLKDIPQWHVESSEWNNDIDYFISICGNEFSVLLNEMRFNRSRATLEAQDSNTFEGKMKNISLKGKLILSKYQFLDYCNELPDRLYDIQSVLSSLEK